MKEALVVSTRAISLFGRTTMLEKMLWCTCGFETMNRQNAIDHVERWHLRPKERTNWELFKIRVKVMIYDQYGGLHIE